MAEDSIPADLRDFILRNIDSVAQLETMLLLHLERDAAWTAAKLSKRLYIGEPEALVVLTRVANDGFASQVEGRFSFDPQSAEKEQMLERLATAYGTRLIPITNLIHSKSPRIREFSDAFKFRKDRT